MRLALAGLVLLIAASPAHARVVVERAESGGTRAELQYDRFGDRLNPSFGNFEIRIYEDDVFVFDQQLDECCSGYAPARFGRKPSVFVRDLDGGAPEVFVDFYSGGAYCCWVTHVFRKRGDSYARTVKNWGPKRQRLDDLVDGPQPEWLAHDDRFLKPYGCNFCWRFLPHVWRFDDGKFRDVTRRYPAVVRPKSKKLRRKYFRASRRGDDVKPIVAPYVATTYLLQKPDDGWDLVRRALRRGELVNHRGRYDFCPCGSRYPKALRRFLSKTGYR